MHATGDTMLHGRLSIMHASSCNHAHLAHLFLHIPSCLVSFRTDADSCKNCKATVLQGVGPSALAPSLSAGLYRHRRRRPVCNMEVSDWRCVSRHYILELVERAVPQLMERFQPTLLVAAGPHAVSVASTLKSVLKERSRSAGPTILTSDLEVYDEEHHPYNPVLGKWDDQL